MLTTSHINPATTELGEKFYQLEPDSITLEEGDLLYALVRMRKPKLAIETGTGHGYATMRIADALVKNGEGFLISCDTDEECVKHGWLLRSRFVDVLKCTGLHVLRNVPQVPEFIFIDAGDAANRMEELKIIVEKDLLAAQGTLVIHDTHKDKYKPLVEYVKSQGWTYMIFDTLAGIAVFQHP